MKAVKNISGVTLSIDFAGDTYRIDKSPVSVSEELYNHLQETYPMAFDFEFSSNKPILKVKSTKTPVRMGTSITDSGIDMRAGLKSSPEVMFNSVDGLPGNGNIDKDGVEWSEQVEMTGGK